MNNHIDMIKFVAEASEEGLNIKKVRNYSPFYSMLEQALSLAESLFYLLEFLKTDREGKFDIKDFKDTIDLLEYYLFVLKKLFRINVCAQIDTSTVRGCQ